MNPDNITTKGKPAYNPPPKQPTVWEWEIEPIIFLQKTKD